MSRDGNTPEVRTFIRRAGLLRVRLIQGIEGPLGKIDVSQLRLSGVLTLPREEGESLIAKGWAIALDDEPVHAHAADACSPPMATGVELPPRDVDEIHVPRRRRADRAAASASLPAGWADVTGTRLNTLMIGPRIVTGRLASRLTPHLVGPVVWVRPPAPFTLPRAAQVGTVILRDAGDLGVPAQRYFLDWLSNAARRPRIIATAPVSLWPMVVAGSFLELLYYRLNVICVRVNDPTPISGARSNA